MNGRKTTSSNKERVAAIVFDFDGVLVDSNQLKYDAFFDVVGAEHATDVARVLRKGRELPRRDIFARLAAEIGVPVRRQTGWTAMQMRRYSNAVMAGIRGLGLRPASLSVLRDLARRYCLYVSSTTPERELRALLGDLGVSTFLSGAYGWPGTKIDTLARLIGTGLHPRQILVVGDGRSDRRAAAHYGCPFVGVVNTFNGWKASDRRNQIRDLKHLPTLLQRREIRGPSRGLGRFGC